MGLLQEQQPQQEAPHQPPQQQAPQQQPLSKQVPEQEAKEHMCAFSQHKFVVDELEALFVWACLFPHSPSG